MVIDRGRIVADASVDDLQARAVAVSGRKGAVDEFVAHREVLSRQGVGSLATAIVAGPLDDIARAGARDLQLELGPVSLQEFVIRSSGDMREKDQRMSARETSGVMA